MRLWMIEPRDPLVVRDGRPNNGRSESATLPFPYPSTIAGLVRTRLGSDDRGVFDAGQDLASLLHVAIRGPLLARQDGGRLYVPRPRDAVVFGSVLHQLVPRKPPPGARFDGDFSGEPVDFTSPPAGSVRKSSQQLAWWPWHLFARWLAEPGELDGSDADERLRDSLSALHVETRSHVKLTETWTAEEGRLFQTSGLRFTTEGREPLALAIDIDTSTINGRALRAGIGPCGGERRLAFWEPAPPSLSLPMLPERVRAALAVQEPSVRVRIVLLTPAIFADGWKPGSAPGQLLGHRSGITPKLVAACVPRPETISGWDFAKQQPKKTRRLVSAGSVYWLDIEGAPDDRVRWANEVMMTNVSDARQDQLDGFGLAAVGVAS
jgi:CRISPR-associated protein Cmr3